MNDQRLIHDMTLMRQTEIAVGVYAMSFAEPALAARARPGQFLMLSLGGGIDPYLRRPFSLAGIDRESGVIEIIYQVAGKGTQGITEWDTGRHVNVLGPLGNGFHWGADLRQAILVGGGLGIAPLLPLAKSLREQGVEVDVFLGAKSIDLLFGMHQFSDYGAQVQIATQDGSGGAAGLVTLPLEARLQTYASAQASGNAAHTGNAAQAGSSAAQAGGSPAQAGNATQAGGNAAQAASCLLFACGPNPFLLATTALCSKYAIEAQFSLEERMGCGFGACMGCSIPLLSPDGSVIQKRVCHDGPVFSAKEVLLNG